MVVLCVLQRLALAHTDQAESCAGLQLDSEEDLVQRCLDRLPVEEAESCLVRLENHLITVDIIRAGVTADDLAGELGFTARECDAVLLNDAAWRSKYESVGEPAPAVPPSEEWDLHQAPAGPAHVTQGVFATTKRRTRTAVCVSGQIRSLYMGPGHLEWPAHTDCSGVRTLRNCATGAGVVSKYKEIQGTSVVRRC
jgi:hypothetical protein